MPLFGSFLLFVFIKVSPSLALLLRISFARSFGATKAEAEVDAAGAGPVPDAVSGATRPREDVPAAAAQDTVIARR